MRTLDWVVKGLSVGGTLSGPQRLRLQLWDLSLVLRPNSRSPDLSRRQHVLLVHIYYQKLASLFASQQSAYFLSISTQQR